MIRGQGCGGQPVRGAWSLPSLIRCNNLKHGNITLTGMLICSKHGQGNPAVYTSLKASLYEIRVLF